MTNLQWRIGDVKISRVVESVAELPGTQLLPDATPEALARHRDWLVPDFCDEAGNMRLSIHALVVESAGQRILVDTCVGEKEMPGFELLSNANNTFLADLVAAGYEREGIDTVLCTHLHFDHVGWNTMKRGEEWVPTFPNARYLFAREEWEFWKEQSASPFTATLDTAVRPILEAGLADLVESDHRLTDEVWLESTPGHTPGHVAVRIRSRGQEALITGDLTHHPVQWAEPQWPMMADSDSSQAFKTRERLIHEHADTSTLIIGTHYPAPTAGRLVGREGVCRFETEDRRQESARPSET